MDGLPLNGPGGVNSKNNLSRAEQFDNEKKRIIESCFSKREEDGSISESYITHLRIEEDAASPAYPPPPSANNDTKKARTIIVAVRKSGRVRVHKARENANGSFSIGKTWLLDDLSAIQSYTGNPTGPDGEQHKMWAGVTGFNVTLGKSYYWKANSQKEKQFFIASLLKIYHKYTGGRIPDLAGFDTVESDQLSGAIGSSRALQPKSSATNPAQLQNRTPQRDAFIQNDSVGDAGQRPLPPPSGNLSIKKPLSRITRGGNFAGNTDQNTSSISIPARPSLTKLKSSQISKTLSRVEDRSNVPSQTQSYVNNNDISYQSERSQNLGAPTDSHRSVPGEGILSSRIKKRGGHDQKPAPAPLALAPEMRGLPSQNRSQSRERPFGSVKTPVPAPLYSPAFKPEETLQPRSTDKMKKSEHNATGEEPSSILNSIPKKNLLDATLSSSPLKIIDQAQEEEIHQGIGTQKSKSKADVSEILNGATNVLNSFKPRNGGVSDRFRESQDKSHDDLNVGAGIAPGQWLVQNLSSKNLLAPSSSSAETRLPREYEEKSWSQPKDLQSELLNQYAPPILPVNGINDNSITIANKKVKLFNDKVTKQLAVLGIDPLIIGGRGNELKNTWEQFGWFGDGIRTKNIDEMKDEVERELCRIQAGGWLSRLEEDDEKIEAIKTGFDKVAEECDELDGLLTLYLVELSTLNEDVAYIEAQSQGLQVQTANQKLLQAELQSLLQTISISPEQIESLRESSLETTKGLAEIERSLVILYKAMLTIDPSIGLASPRSSEDGSLISGKPGAYGNSEIGSMRVLQEKKDVYKTQISIFLRRLKSFLQIKFAANIDQTRQSLEREKGTISIRNSGRSYPDFGKYDLAKSFLWKYSPLMLFTREVDRLEWEDFMRIYAKVSMPLYQEEFQEVASTSKRAARKLAGDEIEFLFVSQADKQIEGRATAARKLTVMKSQNLAKSLLSPIGDPSKTSIDKISGLEPYEVIEEIISHMTCLMSMEQNFFVEFFHVSTLGQHDFPETVIALSPEERNGVDLRRPRALDPNRDLTMLVAQYMEDIFSFFTKDIQAIIDWCLQIDPLQVVGIIASLERKASEYEETNQEYISPALQKLRTQLIGLFMKLLDDQIRVIEETKVKIKKRKGVIGLIKTFPLFSNALEKKLVGAQDLEIRKIINNAYSRVNKAMFEALKVIARENPGAQIAGSDPADKEALNYEILLMQNMHYYLEEVDSRSNPILEEWKNKANIEMDEHMTLYLNAVIRRPLGKLLDFLESTESLMLSREPGEPITKISGMPSHSKISFKKVLSSYDSKEIRRGIETLKKRVEKHFGDDHDPGMGSGSGLVTSVLQRCEKCYEDVENRILTISRDVYNGEVVAEWTRVDISAAFRK